MAQAYQTSENVLPRGGIFLDKWRSCFAGNPDAKMNVQFALRTPGRCSDNLQPCSKICIKPLQAMISVNAKWL
jgi:hypothetical protein